MEDCNALVSDCIILSCCCQCLILRFFVFVFFQVPRKVARKLKEYAKRKLISSNMKKKKKKKNNNNNNNKQSDDDGDGDGDDDSDEIVNKKQRVEDRDDEEDDDDDDDDEFNMCLRILELEGIRVKEVHNWGNCDEEVDKVLGELALKGEFGFGSFWGKKSETTEIRNCNCIGSRSLLKEDELEFVKFHLIEVIGPFSSSQ